MLSFTFFLIKSSDRDSFKYYSSYRNYSEIMNKAKNMSSIQLSKETKKMLDKLGKKGDSYEDIILKLLTNK